MLRWSGDYTLPRFRAKLATKYLHHPHMEPEYAEVYRPDLGESTHLRKESSLDWKRSTSVGDGISRGLRTDTPSGAKRSLFDTTGPRVCSIKSRELLHDIMRLEDELDDDRVQRVLASGAAQRPPLWSTRPPSMNLDSTIQSEPSQLYSGSFSSTLPRQLGRSTSVPILGVRRAEVTTGVLRPIKNSTLRPGSKAGATSSSTAMMSPPASPASPSSLERKRDDKNKLEVATKQLWVATHGGEFYFKEAASTDDPVGKDPSDYIKDALNNGADVNMPRDEWNGGTLLLKAARTGQLELAMFCLEKDGKADVVDNSGRGVLHWAALEGHMQLVQWLLVKVPTLSPKELDYEGDGPLHLAAFGGSLPIVRLLVRAKANPQARSGTGFTPLDLAEARRKWHVARYLRDARQQEDDLSQGKAGLDEKCVRDLVRPCDLSMANTLRAENMEEA